jgi:beta-aspartyl-peptidase (threonine type)
MKATIVVLILLVIPLISFDQQITTSPPRHCANWALVVHGGAGGSFTEKIPAATEKMYRDSLDTALKIGAAILSSGGSSLDAVEAVIRFMEDCPLFNAGRGAVYNAEGFAELDASFMDGKSGLAGAVAGVQTIRHPISASRRVMEKTRHVLLMGKGAEEFAAVQGLEIVDPSFFRTPDTDSTYQRMLRKKKQDALNKQGTVGCVARDVNGNLAAGTSTGGMMMKMKGRVGDSPIIGAGTYADNATCAVSCTGSGEYFIRDAVAYDVTALMKYKKMSLEKAAAFVIMDKLKKKGGGGGLIAVDKDGHIAMPFNTAMMFRGYVKGDGSGEISVY